MIGCETKNGVVYITKLEDFCDLVDDNIYFAFVEFINCNYVSTIQELQRYIKEADVEIDDLDSNNGYMADQIERADREIDKIKDGDFSKEEILSRLKHISSILM
jgi:hypothetical protein